MFKVICNITPGVSCKLLKFCINTKKVHTCHSSSRNMVRVQLAVKCISSPQNKKETCGVLHGGLWAIAQTPRGVDDSDSPVCH